MVTEIDEKDALRLREMAEPISALSANRTIRR